MTEISRPDRISATLEEDLKAIFMAGVSRVDPEVMMRRQLRLEGNTLQVLIPGAVETIDLENYTRILVVGAGKASGAMARGLEAVLGERISGGLVVTKDGHVAQLSRVRLVEAGHPVPDLRSVKASRDILNLVRSADSRTLVIGLISGGGSALLTLPFGAGTAGEPAADQKSAADQAADRAADQPSATGQKSATGKPVLSLEELQETTRLLLASGAVIQDMNCVRKHLSDISGGRLAQAIASRGARGITFILSDVLGDSLENIASGPTAPDPSTYHDAMEILSRHGLLDRIPAKVLSVLRQGQEGTLIDTPKPGSEVFTRQSNCIIGSNAQALEAAATEARTRGYAPLILSSRVYGEAREIAKFYYGMARDLEERGLPLPAPSCILAGGETTVTLRGQGKGGRNQEMAAAFLAEAIKEVGGLKCSAFLSAGTDGNDGPTDAAGGIVTPDIIRKAAAAELAAGALAPGTGPEPPSAASDIQAAPSLRRALEENNSYPCLETLGALYRTGPTNTNVCDIQIILTR